MSRFFGGVAAATARRPWPVLILAVLLGAISIWAAGGMGSQNVTDAFFDKGSAPTARPSRPTATSARIRS